MSAAERERADDNVQAMRDQGIRDALSGYPAFCWFSCGRLYASGREGTPLRVNWAIGDNDAAYRYRETIAYATAYEAELSDLKGAE